MSALKLLALAAVFIATGGIIFSEYFRKNKWVRGVAALSAVVAFAYLLLELKSDFFGRQEASGKPTAAPIETASIPQPEKVVVVPLAGHTLMQSLAFSPDGDKLYILGKTGRIVVWDMKLNTAKMAKHSTASPDTAFSDDGQSIIEVTRSGGAIINLRADTRTEFAYPSIPTGEIVNRVAISNNASLVAIASYVRVKKTNDKGKEEDTLKPHLRIYSLQAKKFVCHVDFYHSDYISDLAFSGDGRSLASASWDGTARLFAPDCSSVDWYYGDRYVNAVAIDASAKRVATGAYGAIRLYKESERHSQGTFVAFSSARRLRFDARGFLLASASEKWVELFDAGTGAKKGSQREHNEDVIDVAFDRSGSLLASVSKDGGIVFWETQDLLKWFSKLHLFSDGEWAILFSNGEFCGSANAARWLRVRKVKHGYIWNSNIDTPMTSDVQFARLAKTCGDKGALAR